MTEPPPARVLLSQPHPCGVLSSPVWTRPHGGMAVPGLQEDRGGRARALYAPGLRPPRSRGSPAERDTV